MFKYWWWAFVLMVGCYVVNVWSLPFWPYADRVSCLLYQLLFFATCAATRPSIMKKDCAYFRSQMYAFIMLIIFSILASKVVWSAVVLQWCTPWYIFSVLFFLDSGKGLKNFLLSMWYALKMIVFNLPLLFIIKLCFNLLVWVAYYFFFGIPQSMYMIGAMLLPLGVMLPTMQNILAALLLPIFICIYANIYIKKLHDQFDLYFKPVQ
jgi:hypothetical protein